MSNRRRQLVLAAVGGLASGIAAGAVIDWSGRLQAVRSDEADEADETNESASAEEPPADAPGEPEVEAEVPDGQQDQDQTAEPSESADMSSNSQSTEVSGPGPGPGTGTGSVGLQWPPIPPGPGYGMYHRVTKVLPRASDHRQWVQSFSSESGLQGPTLQALAKRMDKGVALSVTMGALLTLHMAEEPLLPFNPWYSPVYAAYSHLNYLRRKKGQVVDLMAPLPSPLVTEEYKAQMPYFEHIPAAIKCIKEAMPTETAAVQLITKDMPTSEAWVESYSKECTGLRKFEEGFKAALSGVPQDERVFLFLEAGFMYNVFGGGALTYRQDKSELRAVQADSGVYKARFRAVRADSAAQFPYGEKQLVEAFTGGQSAGSTKAVMTMAQAAGALLVVMLVIGRM